MSRRPMHSLYALLVALVAASALPGVAQAQFGIETFSGAVTDRNGDPMTQAGAHPYEVTTTMDFDALGDQPAGLPKTLRLDLPAGFVGDPQAAPTCTREQFYEITDHLTPGCPLDTQVGVVEIKAASSLHATMPIFNMEPPRGVTAQFGFQVLLVSVFAEASVRSDSDHGIRVTVPDIAQTLGLLRSKMTLWGTPADPAHDALRGAFCLPDPSGFCMAGNSPAGVPPKPFLTNPMDCAAGPLTTRLTVNSWETPDVFETASYDHDESGVPMEVEGCSNLGFEPKMSVTPTSTSPDSPTGLAVDVSIPQEDNPDGLATPPLDDVRVTLPEGMTINPASADGLGACSDAQLGLGSMAPPSCPDSSKIGAVRVHTPVLDRPLEGAVYVRAQASGDPESGDMFRIALIVEDPERGLRFKLPGRIVANSATGRLAVTFRDNPQLPVSRIEVRLKSGPRAPLATPARCGTKTVDTRLSSWAGHLVGLDSSFEVDCSTPHRFAPAFKAGSTVAAGGAFSPFTVRIDREDRHGFLSGVRLDLPEGLLAKLAGVPLCGAPAAAGGGCPVASRVGTATVGAGPGSHPFYLRGPVFLTEGYKGAPYGLAVHVHAKAGPFDLGWVRVRQALHVDPETAAVSVVSDPLPQIVKGVPVRLRSVDVDVDRPGFAVNPTSCAEKRVEAMLTSVDGAVHRPGSRFQVGDCRALGFRPRLGMRLVGKGRMRSGGHPALRAVVRQGGGQANIRSARVTLPSNVVLDSENSTDPELLCGYEAAQRADCPASSVIGRASLNTPLLNRPLSGPVHLVQGIRFEDGNRIRTLPTLLVKLRGEVAIDLRSKTNVDGRDRLVSSFPNVPDARAARFSIQVDGGRKGILVVTESRRGRIDLCNRRQIALVETDGHNGKRADYPVRVKTPCRSRASASPKRRNRAR